MSAPIWAALLGGIFAGYCFGRAWAAHLEVKRLDAEIAAIEAALRLTRAEP